MPSATIGGTGRCWLTNTSPGSHQQPQGTTGWCAPLAFKGRGFRRPGHQYHIADIVQERCSDARPIWAKHALPTLEAVGGYEGKPAVVRSSG